MSGKGRDLIASRSQLPAHFCETNRSPKFTIDGMAALLVRLLILGCFHPIIQTGTIAQRGESRDSR
jgi:hypothetical protein